MKKQYTDTFHTQEEETLIVLVSHHPSGKNKQKQTDTYTRVSVHETTTKSQSAKTDNTNQQNPF